MTSVWPIPTLTPPPQGHQPGCCQLGVRTGWQSIMTMIRPAFGSKIHTVICLSKCTAHINVPTSSCVCQILHCGARSLDWLSQCLWVCVHKHTTTNIPTTTLPHPYKLHHSHPVVLPPLVLLCFVWSHVPAKLFSFSRVTHQDTLIQNTHRASSMSSILLNLYLPQQQEEQQVLSCTKSTAAIHRLHCEDHQIACI